MLIEHVFVVNLKNRNDRWKKINEKFKNTNLKLQRWEAVYGKELSQTYIDNVTTNFCRNFCSDGMIGCWLSHYNLWNHISKNNLDNVLILEDDAEPIKNFDKELNDFLKCVPNDYDIVYLGCRGSCRESANMYFKLLYGKGNEDYNEKLMIPIFPITTHAYLISNKGATQLLNCDEFKKVNHHIDVTLANYFYTNSNLKVYASKTSLITQFAELDKSDILTNEHPLLSYPLAFVNIDEFYKLDYLMNSYVVHIRKLSVDVSNLMLILFFISFLIGFFGSAVVKTNYLYFLVGLYIVETVIKLLFNYRINYNNIMFEILMIFLIIYTGIVIRDVF